VDTGILCLGEGFGHAVITLGESRLFEPRQRPAAVGVEIALLLGQRLVEHLVDKRERLYNVFVKLEMNKADYLKAKTDVLQKLLDGFKNEAEIEAKQKAEKLLKDLKDEIKAAT